MKKKYISPELELVEMESPCLLEASLQLMDGDATGGAMSPEIEVTFMDSDIDIFKDGESPL